MGHAVRAAVAARGDGSAHGNAFAHVVRLEFEDLPQDAVRVAPAADQIADGRQRRHPDRTAGGQLGDAFRVHVCAVLDAVHAGVQRIPHRLGTVGVRHDGHAAVVRVGDHIGDLRPVERRAGERAKLVEVDQAGDHDLDEIRPEGNGLVHQRAVFGEIGKRAPDKAAVAALPADGKARLAIVDAVFRSQNLRAPCGAERIAAVAQEAHAAGGVFG